MDKQYFFLNGVPRAGNTLLATILNQNPDMQVSANSLGTGGLLHQAHSLTSSELFKNFPDNKSLDNVLENIIPNYYKDWNCKYIIDRSQVGIQDILLLLKKYFDICFGYSFVICPNLIKFVRMNKFVHKIFKILDFQ